jgi:hypothetical protein
MQLLSQLPLAPSCLHDRGSLINRIATCRLPVRSLFDVPSRLFLIGVNTLCVIRLGTSV